MSGQQYMGDQSGYALIVVEGEGDEEVTRVLRVYPSHDAAVAAWTALLEEALESCRIVEYNPARQEFMVETGTYSYSAGYGRWDVVRSRGEGLPGMWRRR